MARARGQGTCGQTTWPRQVAKARSQATRARSHAAWPLELGRHAASHSGKGGTCPGCPCQAATWPCRSSKGGTRPGRSCQGATRLCCSGKGGMQPSHSCQGVSLPGRLGAWSCDIAAQATFCGLATKDEGRERPIGAVALQGKKKLNYYIGKENFL